MSRCRACEACREAHRGWWGWRHRRGYEEHRVDIPAMVRRMVGEAPSVAG